MTLELILHAGTWSFDQVECKGAAWKKEQIFLKVMSSKSYALLQNSSRLRDGILTSSSGESLIIVITESFCCRCATYEVNQYQE